MQIIADTNIWLRIADSGSSQHSTATSAVTHLLNSGAEIFLVPQNLIEFWAVATRPLELNGLGWTTETTDQQIATMLTQFSLLPENERIFGKWNELVRAHKIAGKKVHDARLAAQLIVHNVSHLLTFNDRDFRHFKTFTVATPNNPQSLQ